MNLKELEARKLLKLPSAGAWGGSFSGGDEFYTGDESQLVFIGASDGGSSSGAPSVALRCSFKNNVVTSRIRNISHRLNKVVLIGELDKMSGKPMPHIYAAVLVNVVREEYLCKICKERYATGPKIVGAEREGASVKALMTLLMCDQCFEAWQTQAK